MNQEKQIEALAPFVTAMDWEGLTLRLHFKSISQVPNHDLVFKSTKNIRHEYWQELYGKEQLIASELTVEAVALNSEIFKSLSKKVFGSSEIYK